MVVTLADMLFSGEMTLDLGGCKVQVVESEAPHTDDSTLVYVVEDKVLFLGDSPYDEFKTGEKDLHAARNLQTESKQLIRKPV